MDSRSIRPDHLPRRINQYVPAMQYAADVIHGAPQRISFGTPAVAAVGFIVASVALVSGAALTATVANDDLLGTGSGAKWGRNVTITSGGANTRDATVVGRDYLGQPMAETIVFNGAATVQGVKAFAYIDSVAIDSEANTPTISVGFGDKLGLPFRTIKILSEESDGATVSTLGTLVTGILTDPQTLTTVDPKGTYDPQTTLDGAKEITITTLVDGVINSAGNGGLHGIAHVAS